MSGEETGGVAARARALLAISEGHGPPLHRQAVCDLLDALDVRTRERDEARDGLARVEALADELEACGITSIYESALELSEIIRAALGDGRRQG